MSGINLPLHLLVSGQYCFYKIKDTKVKEKMNKDHKVLRVVYSTPHIFSLLFLLNIGNNTDSGRSLKGSEWRSNFWFRNMGN